MSKRTKELETYWWDWLSTSERLIRSLHEQTVALTLRQLDRINAIRPELESLMNKMAEIDDKAAASAKKLAEELGSEPNLRSLVVVLEKAEAQQVQALANRVIVVGRNISEIIAKNKALIENELEYVNGTIAIVAREAVESKGGYKNSRHTTSLLMDQAA